MNAPYDYYNGTQSTIQVLLFGEDADTAFDLVSEPLNELFRTVETVRHEQELINELSSTATTAIVCTASTFEQTNEIQKAARPQDRHLIVVDTTQGSTDIEKITTRPRTTYVHIENPVQQVISLLKMAFTQSELENKSPTDYVGPKKDSIPIEPAEFLSHIFVNTPLPLVVAEVATGTIVGVNHAATEFLGRPCSSLLGMRNYELHPPKKQKQCREAYNRVVTQADDNWVVKLDQEDTLEIYTGDGQRIPVDYQGKVISIGSKLYLLTIFRDATDQLNRQAEMQHRAVAMNESLTGISILSKTGEFVYMNDSHAGIFDYTPTELLGKSWRVLYDDEQQAVIENDIYPEIEESGSWNGELTGIKKDGSPVGQHVSLTGLSNGGLVCVNRDITSRRCTERQLKQIRNSIDSFVFASDHTEVIDRAIKVIIEILGHQLVGYYRYNNIDDELQPVKLSPESERLVDNVPTFRRGEGLAWKTFDSGELHYYPDLNTVDGVYNTDTLLRSELQLPVENYGVFLIGSIDTDFVSKTEQKLLQILVNHVSMALKLVDQTNKLNEARQKAEAERQQLREVIDAVPQLVFAKNDAGEFIFANEAVAEAYGTTVSGIEGQSDSDFAPEQSDVEAFRTDDLKVLETKEKVHTIGERLIDVDGNERILDTWKIPFEPAGADSLGVLGVSTDISELEKAQTALERLQRLNALYQIGHEAHHAQTAEEILEVGADLIKGQIYDESIKIYRWDETDATLKQTVAIGNNVETKSNEVMRDSENVLWKAFSEQQITTTVHDDSGEHTLAVPIDSYGLIVVSGLEDEEIDDINEFVQSAAQTLASRIQLARQDKYLNKLRSEFKNIKLELSKKSDLYDNFSTAIENILQAQSKEEIDEILLTFATTVGEYAWIGDYLPQNKAVVVRKETQPDGPAKDISKGPRTEPIPPVIKAATERKPIYIKNTVGSSKQDKWNKRLLKYGYQSILAVPIISGGTIYGVIETATTETEGLVGSLEIFPLICHAAASRVKILDSNTVSDFNRDAVRFDIELMDTKVLFPSLPADSSVQVHTVDRINKCEIQVQARIENICASVFETYVAGTPGLSNLQVDTSTLSSTDRLMVTVRINIDAREATQMLFKLLQTHESYLSTALSKPDSELLSITTSQPTRVRAVLDEITSKVGRYTLISKQTEKRPSTISQKQGIRKNLTDRQREILQTAHREGYYKQPKEITGAGLADYFDISQSTVHEHLRAAEKKLMDALFT